MSITDSRARITEAYSKARNQAYTEGYAAGNADRNTAVREAYERGYNDAMLLKKLDATCPPLVRTGQGDSEQDYTPSPVTNVARMVESIMIAAVGILIGYIAGSML